MLLPTYSCKGKELGNHQNLSLVDDDVADHSYQIQIRLEDQEYRHEAIFIWMEMCPSLVPRLGMTPNF